MSYKRLWILLEGSDDERFFEKIKPTLEKKFDSVHSWKYAQEPPKGTRNFLKSIKAMKSAYFFWADINRMPCVTVKKDNVKRKYGASIEIDNVIIVVKEIESWYLTGLNQKACREIGIRSFDNTDLITKEDFDNLKPKRFDSRIDFMLEILKRFDIETGKRKNKSFNYFMTKI
jgi:hypothetical protein